MEVADYFTAQQTIKLSNIKSPAPFCVRSESLTRKTTSSANQDFYSIFLTKRHCRYLHIRSLTANATSTLPRLRTHELFKTVKSWTPLTLQGEPRSSQGLITAVSYVLWYDVCAAQHIGRILRTTRPMTKCHILHFTAVKTSELAVFSLFQQKSHNWNVTAGVDNHMHAQ